MATDLEKISEDEREDIIDEILLEYGSKDEEKVTKQASKNEKEDIIDEILSKYSSKTSKDKDETLSKQASKDEKEDIIDEILSEYGNGKSTKADYIPETIHSISTSNNKKPIPKKQSRFANMLRGIFSKITNKNKKTLLLETSNAKTERNLSISKTKNETSKKGFFNRMKSFLFGKGEHNEIPDSNASKQKRYTSRGGKLGALILAASMLGSSSVANLEDTKNQTDDNSNRLIEELPDKDKEFISESEVALQNDDAQEIDWKSADELNGKTIGTSTISDSKSIVDEMDIVDEENTIGKSSNADSSKITVEGNITSKETKINEKVNNHKKTETTIGQSSNADSSEIANTQEEDIYAMQPIGVTENGMRTKEELLFVIDKVRWRQDEKEHIKENLIDGLLYIQKTYGVDTLCALSVFHHESMCGLAYKDIGQIRLANIEYWPGQKGVIGYSKNYNYGLYDDYFSAVADFGNYVRNSKALKGATTMYDLEFNNGYHIFNGASTEEAHTYSRLKEYAKEYKELRKEKASINIDDISDAVGECTAENIQQMTSITKSEIQKENSKDKENEGERNDL